jgi:hypothetical protein
MSRLSDSPEPGELGYHNSKFIADIGYKSVVSAEDFITEACRQACIECERFNLITGFQYLRMGMPAAAPSYGGFGGYVDLDVNRLRVLTVKHNKRKKEIELQDNDKKPPKILATLSIDEDAEENSPYHRNTVRALKELILSLVKSNDRLLELMVKNH